MKLDLDGQRVLVTGGTRGLGAAVAAGLRRRGARVAVTGRFPADDAGDDGIVRLVADAADRADGAAVMAELGERWGGVDVLVHNAALSMPVGSLDAWSGISAEITLQNGVWPLVELVRDALRAGHSPARVVVISSLGAVVCPRRYAYLGVSKAALEALARYLAVDLAPGIAVHTVRFGYLETSGLAAMFSPEELDRARRAGLFVDLEAAADLVAALASGLLDAATGEVIAADRGLSIRDPLYLPVPA